MPGDDLKSGVEEAGEADGLQGRWLEEADRLEEVMWEMQEGL